MVFFLKSVKVTNLLGDLAVFCKPVRGFDKAVIVDVSIAAERNNQSYVRAFRRLYGADTPVVGRMDISHFKPGPLSCQSTGTQGAQAAFVGNLGKGIRLIHEL